MSIKFQFVKEIEEPEQIVDFGKVIVGEFQEGWDKLKVKSLTELVFNVVMGVGHETYLVVADKSIGQSFKTTSEEERFPQDVIDAYYNDYVEYLRNRDTYFSSVLGIHIHIDICMVLLTFHPNEPMSEDDVPCVQVTITSDEETYKGNQFKKTKHYIIHQPIPV